LLDGLAPGDEIDISINLRGREWKSPKDGTIKFFNTIEGWKVESAGSGSGAPQDPAVGVDSNGNSNDDLPF